jgi:endonuclease/exonuclease/phosphatase family metal-dependent hydrolase
MNKKNLFVLLLSLLLVICTVASCVKENGGDETTTEAPETEAPVETVLEADLSKYILIRPEHVSDDMGVVISSFKKKFEEKTGIISIKYKDDFYREGVDSLKMNEFEILVGRTNRPETAEFLASLRYDDYGYTVINKKIVIAGHTDKNTQRAVNKFVSEVLGAEKKDGVFMECVSVVVKGEYKTDNMTVAGLPVNGMKVVYPGANSLSEKNFAENIAEVLSEISGYYIPALNDKGLEVSDSDNLIIVGDSTRIKRITHPSDLEASESYFATNANTILVTGGGSLGIYSAVNEFVSRINNSDGKELSLKAEEKFTLTNSTTRVMSFNLWVSQKTNERTARVIKMITKYMPDSFGVQEASPAWMTSLRSGLSAYAYVGGGRDGGSNGEHSAIFYLKDKYTVLDSGTKWLSATPNSVSKFEESSLNRIVTYAVLKDKTTGKIYVHINTHFDHKSSKARELQADVFLDVAKQFEDYPVVMTGDFNCTAGSAPYNKIISAGYVNSSEVAPEKHGSATFHGNGSSSSIIDFCFITPGKMAAISYRVCDEKIDGALVSDHHPVYVDFIY